jgi:hypothetical protein
LLQLSRKSDLRLCFFYDPVEVSLPKNGLFPVTDGHNRLVVNTHDKNGLEKYRQQFTDRKLQVASIGNYLECKTDDDYLTLLTGYD